MALVPLLNLIIFTYKTSMREKVAYCIEKQIKYGYMYIYT